MRYISLLRHARTEAAHATLADFDRVLTNAGIAQCHALADYLQGRSFDRAWCSPASRTSQTLELAIGSIATTVQKPEKLYNASAHTWIKTIAETDSGITNLLLIGHNPGLQELAIALAPWGTSRIGDCLLRHSYLLPIAANGGISRRIHAK